MIRGPRIADDFALLAARQIEIAHEHVARIMSTFVAIARASISPIALT